MVFHLYKAFVYIRTRYKVFHHKRPFLLKNCATHPDLPKNCTMQILVFFLAINRIHSTFCIVCVQQLHNVVDHLCSEPHVLFLYINVYIMYIYIYMYIKHVSMLGYKNIYSTLSFSYFFLSFSLSISISLRGLIFKGGIIRSFS